MPFQCHRRGGTEKEFTTVPGLESWNGETSAYNPGHEKSVPITVERLAASEPKMYRRKASRIRGGRRARMSYADREVLPALSLARDLSSQNVLSLRFARCRKESLTRPRVPSTLILGKYFYKGLLTSHKGPAWSQETSMTAEPKHTAAVKIPICEVGSLPPRTWPALSGISTVKRLAVLLAIKDASHRGES
jgi:hypothetical protein